MVFIVAGAILGFFVGLLLNRRGSRLSGIGNTFMSTLLGFAVGSGTAVFVSVSTPTQERFVGEEVKLVSMSPADESDGVLVLTLSQVGSMSYYLYWTRSQSGLKQNHIQETSARIKYEGSSEVPFFKKFVREPIDPSSSWYQLPLNYEFYEFHIPKGGLLRT